MTDSCILFQARITSSVITTCYDDTVTLKNPFYVEKVSIDTNFYEQKTALPMTSVPLKCWSNNSRLLLPKMQNLTSTRIVLAASSSKGTDASNELSKHANDVNWLRDGLINVVISDSKTIHQRQRMRLFCIWQFYRFEQHFLSKNGFLTCKGRRTHHTESRHWFQAVKRRIWGSSLSFSRPNEDTTFNQLRTCNHSLTKKARTIYWTVESNLNPPLQSDTRHRQSQNTNIQRTSFPT